MPTGLANASEILLEKVLEKNSVLKIKRGSHGSRHGPTWVLPLPGLVLGVQKGAVLINLLMGVSCFHKAGNVLGIGHGSTLVV